MFDYPFTLPKDTAYDKLGVGPEADPQEISDAKLSLARRLKRDEAQVNKRIEAVYSRVDGLRAAYDLVALLQARGRDVDPEVIRSAQVNRNLLEQKALKIDPEFKQMLRRSAELKKEIEELNRLSLQNASDRHEYDRGRPPLALLKLPDPARDEFAVDQRIMLALVRRELIKFISRQGEAVFHPTDLTREDFTGDFTYVKLLDG